MGGMAFTRVPSHSIASTSGRQLYPTRRFPLARAHQPHHEQQQPQEAAWTLMQGFIKEDSIPFFNSEAARLVCIAATTASGLSAAQFATQLQELLLLVPGFEARLQRISPQLLALLVCDTAAVAESMVQLKQIFPTADIAKLVCKRPSVLMPAELFQVPHAASRLRALFGEGAVDAMVEQQPLLLTEDVDAIVDKLQRHFEWSLEQLARDLDTQPHRVAWAIVHFRLRGADAAAYVDDDDDNMARLWHWNALPRSAATLTEEERRGRTPGGG